MVSFLEKNYNIELDLACCANNVARAVFRIAAEHALFASWPFQRDPACSLILANPLF